MVIVSNGFRFSDPRDPWWRRFYDFWRDKCPWCKCWDLEAAPLPSRLIRCRACDRIWAWDDETR